jgi:hypothetical protein
VIAVEFVTIAAANNAITQAETASNSEYQACPAARRLFSIGCKMT